MPYFASQLELKPTRSQVHHFINAAGCARKAWNWGLDTWLKTYASGGKPNWMKLQKEFVASIDSAFRYMRNVPCAVYYQPFRHLHQAWRRFFAGLGRLPRFKAKHRCRQSFKVGKVTFMDGRVVIPLIGAVRLKEHPTERGRIVSATIAADADRWVISVQWEISEQDAVIDVPAERTIGIDLGLATFATVVAQAPQGTQVTKILSPNPLRAHLKRLRRRARRLSHRQKASRRRQRAKAALARLHRRIRNVRKDFLHRTTTALVRMSKTIVIEDLAVSNLVKNHRLARHIADAGWHEFQRQLVYKCVRYQRTLLRADRFYPSSKTCSVCGEINGSLMLSDRVFQCPRCGHRCDRDENAATNLCTLAYGGNDARGEHTALVLAGRLQSQPARRNVNPGAAMSGEKQLTRIIESIPGV